MQKIDWFTIIKIIKTNYNIFTLLLLEIVVLFYVVKEDFMN